MRLKLIQILISLFVLASCQEKKKVMGESVQEEKKKESSVFTNPVLDLNFPDPTVIKAPDGYFYVYGTNSSVEGEVMNIQVGRSKDLVTWEFLGEALPERPSWADKDFWAPHVFYDDNLETYYLYYSGESRGEELGKCMGVATSKDPTGPFVDKGKPLICGEGFVNIDPMAFDDPNTGKKLLYWGSGFGPIKVQELSDDRLDFKKGTTPIDLVFPVKEETPENYQRLVEGAWITKQGDYYYLFYSGDNCCGEEAHYAVMVARSKEATGPFETLEEVTGRESSVVLAKKGPWIAPGHNSVIEDEVGQDWMFYHAIDSTDRKKGRVMLIDRIEYKEGWPNINGGFPSHMEMPAPVVTTD